MAWRTHFHSAVVLHLQDGVSIRGVLLRQDRRTLTLVQATYLAAGKEPIAVDGAVIVERAHLQFAQIIAGAT